MLSLGKLLQLLPVNREAVRRTEPSNQSIINPHVVLFTPHSQQLWEGVEKDVQGWGRGVQFRVKNRQSPGGWCWLAEGGGWGGVADSTTLPAGSLRCRGERDLWTMSARVEQLSWAMAKKAGLSCGEGGGAEVGANIPVEVMFTYDWT